jgi:hypothetical protein
MKQTAVEWLVDNLHYLHSTKWDDIVEQAKEMEKEQIVDAYNEGEESEWGESMGLMGDHYYYETFNTKEK